MKTEKCKCTKCELSFTEEIPLVEEACSHEFEVILLEEATVDSNGLIQLKCTKCADSHTAETPKLEEMCSHEFEIVVLKDASETANGLIKLTCSHCGYSFTQEYPYVAFLPPNYTYFDPSWLM